VAAQCTATGSITDAFRYDAYGKAIGTAKITGVASPWRYQGRISRVDTGYRRRHQRRGLRRRGPRLRTRPCTFTSLDSVAGSAQNPLSLNRYLYANANPETLVDPSGHRVMYDDVAEGYSPGTQTTPALTRASDDNSDWNYGNFHSTASDAIGQSLANGPLDYGEYQFTHGRP